MSLLWRASEQEIVLNEPRLHALVIGVADYPHLNGGTGPLARQPLGLSQITTPRFTAPAIANWLLAKYKNDACKLGSLEILASPGDLVAGPGPVDAATMQSIERSFLLWKGRCASHRENVAFFYFCGHGVAKGAQFLLPQDFGDPTFGEWKNCIDFDGLRVGMRSCPAQTQIFFVDACRETPFGMLTQLNVKGDSLCYAETTDSVECSAAYFATTAGKQAYGPDDGPTYFSKAVLSCLDGVASRKSNGKWVVDTYTLANGLGQIMAQFRKRYKLPLACEPLTGGMAVIHEPSAPRVLAVVKCSSPSASEVAEIVLQQGPQMVSSPVGDAKPIFEEVSAGEWLIDVRFPGGQFESVLAQQHTFMPPLFEGVEVP